MSARRSTLITLSNLVILTLLLSNPSLAANSLPNQFTATYKLELGPIELAKMTRRLYTSDQGYYIFESHSEPKGYARWLTNAELKESSEWMFYNGGLRPMRYTYDRSGNKKRHVELYFDWQKQQITNTINNDPWKMAAPEKTLDKLLYHLAVMRDLELGKTQFEYQIADGGKLKTVYFNYVADEVLNTKLGKLHTIKMHHPGQRKENDTWLWFAKELNYLPVQIQQQKKAGTVMVTIQSLEGIPRRQEATKGTAVAQKKQVTN